MTLTTVGTCPGMICCCICWAKAFFSARWFRPFINSWSCKEGNHWLIDTGWLVSPSGAVVDGSTCRQASLCYIDPAQQSDDIISHMAHVNIVHKNNVIRRFNSSQRLIAVKEWFGFASLRISLLFGSSKKPGSDHRLNSKHLWTISECNHCALFWYLIWRAPSLPRKRHRKGIKV